MVVIKDADIQHTAEVVAALELGNAKLESAAVNVVLEPLHAALEADQEHYLFLAEPDDLSSFFGCGTASGAVEAMVEDKATCRLYSIPKAECPNCKEDEE
jgi:hypothetical protein